MIGLASIMVLASCGYVCGISTLAGFVIGSARARAQSSREKNGYFLLGMTNALVCGAASIFLLGLLVFSYKDHTLLRLLIFVFFIILGASCVAFLVKAGQRGEAKTDP